MKDHFWEIGDIRITKRELLASITIVAIMILLGFIIAGKIESSQMDKNAEYYKAAKITDKDMFRYGMDTSIGNAFVYGTLESVDTVTFPEIGGEYMYVEKVEEHYNRYEDEVKKKDSNGNEYTEIEVSYRWDVEDREKLQAKELKFLGVIFPIEKITIPGSRYIDTIKGDRTWSWKSGEFVKVRFKYYGCQGPYTGTIYTDLRDGTIKDGSDFYQDTDIESTIDYLTSDFGMALFWIAWIVLTGGTVYGFYYLDNEWLEG